MHSIISHFRFLGHQNLHIKIIIYKKALASRDIVPQTPDRLGPLGTPAGCRRYANTKYAMVSKLICYECPIAFTAEDEIQIEQLQQNLSKFSFSFYLLLVSKSANIYDTFQARNQGVGAGCGWTTPRSSAKGPLSQVKESIRACNTRKPCYRKDDRAMRPIYRLFYHNFVHAYVHYFVRI